MVGFSDRTVDPCWHIYKWPSSAVRLLNDNEWGSIVQPTISVENSNIVCNERHPRCCNENCGLWRHQVECATYSHGIGVRCRNMQLQSRQQRLLALYALESDELSGPSYGVVAREDMSEGDLVCEYVGIVKLYGEFDRSSQYVMQLEDDLYLDAQVAGSIARYVNHSCSPNCAFQGWLVPSDGENYVPRVGLYALEDIPANTVVTADYRMMSSCPGSLRCLCGADSCRSFVDVNRLGDGNDLGEEDESADALSEEDDSGLSRAPQRRVVRADAHRLTDAATKIERLLQTTDERLADLRSLPPELLPQTSPNEHGVFLEHGWKYLGLDLSCPDITTHFTNRAGAYQDRDRVDLRTLQQQDRKRATWTAVISVYGRLFVGTGKSVTEGRRSAVRDALTCLLQGGELNPTGPAPMAPAVHPTPGENLPCLRTLEDLCIVGWRELRAFREAISKLGGKGNALYLQEAHVLTSKLVAAMHAFIPTASALLEYLGVDASRVHKGLWMRDEAGDCLLDRRKRVELGSESRLAFARAGYIVFRTGAGPVLTKVGTPHKYDSVHQALSELACSVEDVVDRLTFESRTKRPLTAAALDDVYRKPRVGGRRIRRRQGGVHACAIQRVMWPMRSAPEVMYLMARLEDRLKTLYPAAYIKQLRVASEPSPTAGLTATMAAVPGQCMSSALAATQMLRTEAQWKEDRDWARRVVRGGELSSPGYLARDVPHDTWSALRRVYDRWRATVERENLFAHREIQCGVDEWTCTGGDQVVNDRFYNAIAGTPMSAEEISMPSHEQGLSAVATVEGGEFLRMPEYLHILLGEALSNDRLTDVTVSSRRFLSTDVGQPPDVLHLDDPALGSLFWTASCNVPDDCEEGYKCLVACNSGSFDTVAEYDSFGAALREGADLATIQAEHPGLFGALHRAYGNLRELLPEDLATIVQPTGEQCVGGWSVFTRGTVLRGSPGTWDTRRAGSAGPRIVYIQSLSVGGHPLGGKGPNGPPVYYTDLFELFHGRACYMSILHVADLALVQGVGIHDRFKGVSLGADLDWSDVGFVAAWDKDDFLRSVVQCVLVVMIPQESGRIASGDVVMPGQYTASRKRTSARLPQKTRHRASYARAGVVWAVNVLWVYMNAGPGKRHDFRRSVGEAKTPKLWQGWDLLDRLTAAYRLVSGNLPVDGDVEGYYGRSTHSTGYLTAAARYRDLRDSADANEVFTRLNP